MSNSNIDQFISSYVQGREYELPQSEIDLLLAAVDYFDNYQVDSSLFPGEHPYKDQSGDSAEINVEVNNKDSHVKNWRSYAGSG